MKEAKEDLKKERKKLGTSRILITGPNQKATRNERQKAHSNQICKQWRTENTQKETIR